mmetsp:Transcript_39076/g.72180  ORF Transcript_39076/g.72180 Transcript_39076/m.72180 type:complete len:97 (-) Transcript_39076:23-313(-)
MLGIKNRHVVEFLRVNGVRLHVAFADTFEGTKGSLEFWPRVWCPEWIEIGKKRATNIGLRVPMVAKISEYVKNMKQPDTAIQKMGHRSISQVLGAF